MKSIKSKTKTNIYLMQPLDEYSHKKNIHTINATHKKILLIILAIILLILISNVNNKIRKQKEAKQYETQIAQEQQKKEEEQKQQEQKRKEEEEKKKKETIQITEQGKQNFETIFHSDTKRAFLTFDDGPSTITPDILNTLNEKNIKATFFMLGTSAEKYPDLVKTVYEQGHFIANHGYSHVYSTIYASPQAVLDEFNKTNDIIKNAIGNPNFNSHLFRFPGGYAGGKYAQIKTEAKQLLNENQIYNIDWNCLTGDAETNNLTGEYIMRRLQETSAGKNSLIVLMHDAQAKKATQEMLPQIIDYLAGQGYEFKTFYDIFTQ